ncbi:MAG TPA: hypothetical protein VKY92_06960 [Verrucomicrobiae bacterium]|nr:hypothetical protein [Verrucomicrobiae bacterium]
MLQSDPKSKLALGQEKGCLRQKSCNPDGIARFAAVGGLHRIRRFLAGTMPNVKNFDKLLVTFNSLEDPERAARDLANVSSSPSPMNWPNLQETGQNADMVHNLVTDSYRSRRIVLCDVTYQRFEILKRRSRPDYPEVHDRISSRISS